MKRRQLIPIGFAATFLVSLIAVDLTMASKITSQVQDQLPKATGVSASIPLIDVLQNVTTDSIKSLTINIDNFSLKGSDTNVLLEIKASQISKEKPTRGWERIYVDHVQQAHLGADLDFLRGASGSATPRESH